MLSQISNSTPSTIDVRLFWISAAVLFLLGLVGLPAVMRRRKGRSRARTAQLCATVGFTCVAVLAIPLFRWDATEPVFGQLFSWLCAHGMLAFLLTRWSLGVLRDYGKF
jgi:hypothetical protein